MLLTGFDGECHHRLNAAATAAAMGRDIRRLQERRGPMAPEPAVLRLLAKPYAGYPRGTQVLVVEDATLRAELLGGRVDAPRKALCLLPGCETPVHLVPHLLETPQHEHLMPAVWSALIRDSLAKAA